uniref:Serpentine receptor class gamma n=1 Tax=Haemonchus contortus TaxID=6289 RepID=A0A7I4YQP7_HAECO
EAMSIILQTVVEVALASLYIFVIFIIARTKISEKAFFTMFMATGFADLIALSSNILLRLNRELNLGQEFQHVVLKLATASSMGFVAHMLGNMLITINRFTAICFMQKHAKIWSRKNVRTAIGIQYVASFAACSYLLTTRLEYIQNGDGTTKFKGFQRHIDMLIRSTFVGTCALYATVSVVLNARLLFVWHRISKMSEYSRYSRSEKSLLMYTAFVFVFTMMMCSQQFTVGIAAVANNNDLYLWASKQFFWINDVMVSIPPFFVLLFCSELRKAAFNIFQRKKPSVTVNFIVTALHKRSMS